MGISLYKIRKWYKMMTGKSILHVNQCVGGAYSKEAVDGYYNDLTQKVLGYEADTLVPMTTIDSGETILFSIGIFQFGIGAYDLYLNDKDYSMKTKVLACADWAVENQQDNGGWITFDFKSREQPYSSMAQAEGISLLVRAHILTSEEKYLASAKKAVTFMLKPIYIGGTTYYEGEDVIFKEYTSEPPVLNGWIFSLWGVLDYAKHTGDEEIKDIYDASVKTLARNLPDFDNGFWSKYDIENRICSPFYHKLHIAQLNVMYDLTGVEEFKSFANKWEKYQDSFFNKSMAFFIKVLQKIFE